jgi:hypothetical protein
VKDITPARPGEHFAKINPGAEVSFGLTAAAALLPVLAPAGAQAAWDLNHAAAVEDLLKRYMQSLPQAARVTPPRVIIYTGTAYSRACPDSGITAPSYCPGDHTVYLETRLGDAIDSRYGDFGALSILAHEFGHAVMSQLNRHPTGKQGELAADSFAGGFARFAEAQGALEAGDLNEARATFAAVGDHNVYSHDHHGTPAERQQAFEQGYAYGFRLPGDNGTQSPPAAPVSPPVTPAPTPPTQPSSPAPAQPTDAGPAVALLGLALGAVATIAIAAALIALIRRAGEDDD